MAKEISLNPATLSLVSYPDDVPGRREIGACDAETGRVTPPMS